MNIPFFHFHFRTHGFSIAGNSNSITGVIVTAYLHGKPIFNLVMDKGKPAASPRKFQHAWFWGNLRWDHGPYGAAHHKYPV
jgi:hypothetical protein